MKKAGYRKTAQLQDFDIAQNVDSDDDLQHANVDDEQLVFKARPKAKKGKMKMKKEFPPALKHSMPITKQELIEARNYSDDEDDFTIQMANAPPSPTASQTYSDPRVPRVQDLIRKKAQLTSSHSDEAVTLDRSQLFDAFDGNKDYYPLEKIKDVFTIASGQLTTIDLTGLDQLTDLFFCVVKDLHVNSLFVHNVSTFSASGCHHLTDVATDRLATTFPKLKEVHLDGCKRLTEKSVHSFLTNSKFLVTLNMNSCGVAVVAVLDTDRVVGLQLKGCPLVSPPLKALPDNGNFITHHRYFKDINKIEATRVYRGVVVRTGSMKHSLLDILQTRPRTTQPSQSLRVLSNYTLPGGATFNLVEVAQDLLDAFISERTVYILLYDTDCELEQTTDHLHHTLLYIIAQVPAAIFVVVGLSSGGEGGGGGGVEGGGGGGCGGGGGGGDEGPRSTAPDVHTLLKSRLLSAEAEAQQHVKAMNTSIHVDQKSQDFVTQNCSVRLRVLYDALVCLNEVKVKGQLQFVDGAQSTYVVSCLHEALTSAEEVITVLYPMYSRFCTEFATVCRWMGTRPIKLEDTGAVTAALKVEFHKTFGRMDATYRQCLRLMHMLGYILLVESSPVSYVVSDLQWLADKLDTVQQGLSGPEPAPPPPHRASLKATNTATQSGPVRELLDHLFWTYTHNGELLMLSQLPPSPPTPVERYMLAGAEMAMAHTVTCHYRLLLPPPAGVMSRLISHVGRLRAPVMVWRTGLLIQDTRMEVLISLDGCAVVMTAQVFKWQCGPAAERIDLMSYLWTGLQPYHVAVRYTLASLSLYYSTAFTADGDLLAPSDPDRLVNFSAGHQMASQLVEDDSVRSCEVCGVGASSLAHFWEMKSAVYPTLSHCTALLLNTDHLIQKGSWYASRGGDRKLAAHSSCPLTVEEFSSFSLTFLSGDTSIEIGVRCTETDQSGSLHILDVKNRVFKHDDKNEGLSADFRLDIGDTLTLACHPSVNTGHNELLWLVNGTVCCRVEVDADTKCFPQISELKQVVFLLDCARSPKFLGDLVGWRVNMKLEAADRLNPSLICVATVADITEHDAVLIHFDGWTSRYDYWAETSSSDLHPIGFMSQRAEYHSEWSPSLQKPKGSTEEFDWGSYLKTEEAMPVPHPVFNEAQTENCQPIILHPEINLWLSKKSMYHGMTECSTIRICPAVLGCRVEQAVATTATLDLEAVRAGLPLACLLPADLDLQLLHDPPYKLVFDHARQKLHFLCVKSMFPHFLDSPGVDAGQQMVARIDDVADFLSFSMLRVCGQKEFLPHDMSQLLGTNNSDAYDQIAIDKNLRKIFLMYAAMFYVKNAKLGQAIQAKPMQALWEEMMPGTSPSWYVCPAHARALGSDNLDAFPLVDFAQYGHFITVLDFSNNALSSLPAAIWRTFAELRELNFDGNRLADLPAGLGGCRSLWRVSVAANLLTSLPADLADCAPTLTRLDVSGNPLGGLPTVVFHLTALETLTAACVGLRELSEDVGRLTHLTALVLAGHAMVRLPAAFTALTRLVTLDLSGVRWPEAADHRAVFGRAAFDDFLASNPLLAEIPPQEQESLFSTADSDGQGMLNYKGLQSLAAQLYHKFNRFGMNVTDADPADPADLGGCPPQLFALKRLQQLDLGFHGLRLVPAAFSDLTPLVGLNVSYNPQLESIAAELSGLPDLTDLHLRGCPSLKTPPKEIVSRGFVAVRGYLRRLLIGSVECKRTKLMMVGLGGAGKTSLVNALTTKARQTPSNGTELITDGIDITTWAVTHGGDTVTYSVWDFAGQTVYYNTHQFFLSNRAVYLLLWNIRLGYEHAGLDFWLSSIACHAPKAPIIIIGSHKDQVEKYWLPVEDMRKRYPQICGFHAISTVTGEGLDKLESDLLEVTLREKYMGERVPEAWLNLESNLLRNKAESNLVSWGDVLSTAIECGIYDQTEAKQAIQFLHDLGSVQHFQSEFLRDRVVINPQWIVDAMSCVVSVHDTPIQDGRLYHKDLGAIWRDYDESLLPWLLRLTEEFDLTFPLPAERANLVPCLLPTTEPKFVWPDVRDVANVHETMLRYKFDYLPAGLFNRAQVRLHQFSDSSVIWKKGSLLKKKGHLALLTNKRDGELRVRVQGPRPENILFMVHEVFEALICESFHGVTYDFFVPCTNCLKMAIGEPSMLAASKIRKATELKVPFLQCDKFFHTLSLTELHACMPPDNSRDFDVHLEQSLRDLNDLRDDLTFDIFMLYAADDVPKVGEANKKVAPRRIYEDLQKAGFTVWFSDDLANIKIEDVALTMRDSKVVLVCISDAFCASEHYRSMFHYARQNLAKTIQLAVLGTGSSWQTTSLGILISTEVYVSLKDVTVYKEMSKELCDKLRSKCGHKKTVSKAAPCFISYAWMNSESAVKKGTRAAEAALGWGDPRRFKDILERNDIVCWMDVDRVGEGGLFESIAEGLKHAKVMVACISDEYANSKNCQMEFRFASVVLKIPIVLAIVGTRSTWKTTEVGMLSLGWPDVNFQFESPTSYDRLLSTVRRHLSDDNSSDRTSQSEADQSQDSKQLAFQELLELAQRKFLRQVSLYADTVDATPYPRLFVVDLPDEPQTGGATDHTGQDGRTTATEQVGVKDAEKGAGDSGSVCDTDETAPPASPTPLPPPATPSDIAPLSRPRTGRGSRHSKLVRQTSTFMMAAQLVGSHGASAAPCGTPAASRQLQAKLLCEHEQGWHVTSPSVAFEPMTPSEMDSFLTDVSPYMARVLAIARHGGISLNMFQTEKGRQLQRQMEDECGDSVEFSDEYLRCRHALISLDKDRHHGGLVRCHLPSGKVVWLCEAHRRREGGTALSDDAVDATLTEPAATDDLMVREIRARTRWDETAKGPTGTHSAKSTKAAETQQKKPVKPAPQQPATTPKKESNSKPQPDVSKSKACILM